MPDTRGDVLCPTCGRWTPPAPFCTECGASLEGVIRDPDLDPFRRGRPVDQPGAPWSWSERFEPEPEDQAAMGPTPGAASETPRVDHLAEDETMAAPPSVPVEPPWPSEPGMREVGAGAEQRPAAEAAPPMSRRAGRRQGREAAAASGPPPDAEPPAVEPPRAPPTPPAPPFTPPPVYRAPASPGADGGGSDNQGISGLLFVLFLGLFILALLGGAIAGGVFDNGPTAGSSPTPTAAVETPTPEPTAEPTAEATATSAPTPTPSPPPPSAAPDGFLARAESCLDQPTDSTCGNSGSVNAGDVWVLVSFRHGKPDDVIGVSVLDSGGVVNDESSLSLSFCGTNTDCAGYTYFLFSDLTVGDYDVRVTRNGNPVATTSFTVE